MEITINRSDSEGNVKTGYEQTLTGESIDEMEWEYRCHHEWRGSILISTPDSSFVRTGESCPTDWEV